MQTVKQTSKSKEGAILKNVLYTAEEREKSMQKTQQPNRYAHSLNLKLHFSHDHSEAGERSKKKTNTGDKSHKETGRRRKRERRWRWRTMSTMSRQPWREGKKSGLVTQQLLRSVGTPETSYESACVRARVCARTWLSLQEPRGVGRLRCLALNLFSRSRFVRC